ncbi:MAG: hypothetical protein ACLQQ4_16430, partial [Bacteroidia bacterium]
MKQGSFLSFFLQLLGLSAILFGLLFLVFTRVIVTPGLPLGLMVAILFAITFISHFILMRAGKKSPQAFTYSFMFTSVIRLIIYGIFIVLYGYKHTSIAKTFAITFFGMYIVYTVFEIRSVLNF